MRTSPPEERSGERRSAGLRASAVVLGGLILCGAATLRAQLVFHGQASAAFLQSNSGVSQYVYDNGRATFAWRLDLFADADLSDNVAFLSNVRMLQDQTPHIDYFALSVADIASTGIDVELGQIDIPFGHLADRRYPAQNPFYELPLMNEHLTSLGKSDYRLWTLEPEWAARGDGVPILDGGLYDLGIRIDGAIGPFDLSVAVINGMLSETGVYQGNGLNSHNGVGKVFRLASTLTQGLTVGASYAFGPFVRDLTADSSSALFGEDASDYQQRIGGADVEFARGYFTFYGQAAYNVWKYDKFDLNAFGYSAEGRYELTPRFSLAARVGGLIFNSITARLVGPVGGTYGLVPYDGKWDDDVHRLEGSVGYKVTREMLIKLVAQWTDTFRPAGSVVDDFYAIQAVVRF